MILRRRQLRLFLLPLSFPTTPHSLPPSPYPPFSLSRSPRSLNMAVWLSHRRSEWALLSYARRRGYTWPHVVLAGVPKIILKKHVHKNNYHRPIRRRYRLLRQVEIKRTDGRWSARLLHETAWRPPQRCILHPSRHLRRRYGTLRELLASSSLTIAEAPPSTAASPITGLDLRNTLRIQDNPISCKRRSRISGDNCFAPGLQKKQKRHSRDATLPPAGSWGPRFLGFIPPAPAAGRTTSSTWLYSVVGICSYS